MNESGEGTGGGDAGAPDTEGAPQPDEGGVQTDRPADEAEQAAEEGDRAMVDEEKETEQA